jgi:hypothetical protein
MYRDTKTWNPFVGCYYGCVYCKASFQRQLKRWAKKNCNNCYNYVPHAHPERLKRFPSTKYKIVFVDGDGDITFCPLEFVKETIESIKGRNEKNPEITYYFQSKNPACFKNFMHLLPKNCILLTTLETNRDEGYEKISKAPRPSVRFRDFLELDYPRKVVTIEPIMGFDQEVFLSWIIQIKPEYVWIGYNSRPKSVRLPEPSLEKPKEFIKALKDNGIEVRGKDTKDIKVSKLLEEN